MKAVIVAEGPGTRLQPLTLNTPKPLITIGEYPVLEHTIKFLKKNGITDLYISVHYLKEAIMEYFQTGEKWGVTINFYQPGQYLNTAGAVKALENQLTEPFLALYCDYLMYFDLSAVLQAHASAPKNTAATVITSKYFSPENCDHVILKGNTITDIITRPLPKKVWIKNMTNRGIYICNPEIFLYIQNESPSFEKDVFPQIIQSNKHSLNAYVTEEYIAHMGTLPELEIVRKDYQTKQYLKSTRIKETPEYFSIT